MYEGSDEGPDDGRREAPPSESSRAEPVATELPTPSDSVGKVKEVWGGVLGFISATLAMYSKMNLTEEELREKQYKWKQREAIDTSDAEERALRVKYVLEYKEERAQTEAFRAEQLEHMRRCETIERERTDRIVATLREGFSDVIVAMKFEPQPKDVGKPTYLSPDDCKPVKTSEF
jgi:hypothetical protein